MRTKFYFLFISILFLTLFSSARAATFTVTLGGDSNHGACGAFCTLRDALNAANANGAGADTINFNLNPAVTILQLSSPLPTIQTSLTIDGTTQSGYFGSPIIVLDGAGVAGGANGLHITTPASNSTLNVSILALAINRFNGNGIYSNCTNTCNLTIQGNRIGTNSSGLIPLGNALHGIYIVGSPNSTFNIGGTGTFEGNLISANGSNGINLDPAANTTTNIYANLIGLNQSGNADLGNTGSGIQVGTLNQANQMTVNIGGTNTAARNIISGNDQNGIYLLGQTTLIYGNYIGTDTTGAIDLGNSGNGIDVGGNARATVGGTVNGQSAGNVISGNNVFGVSINSTDLPQPILIKRNRIGTNANGTAAVGNGFDGISVGGMPFSIVAHVIGSDTISADGNLISGNLDDGISLGAAVSGIKVFGNQIGTNLAATLKIPNQGNGIDIGGAFNQIGSVSNNTAANIIGGNQKNGIHIHNSSAVGNDIKTNFIGTNASGDNLGNALDGTLIGTANAPTQMPSGNFIGEPSPNAGNTIAFNGGDGVDILFGTDNRIQRNSIYSNGGLGIDLGTNGVTFNDNGDTDTGANNLQNFPYIGNASPTQVYGSLNSTPNALFTIDFYRVDSCDASAFGEGRYHIAQRSLSVTNNGTGVFNYMDISLTVGQIIVATATDPNGNTSEFSQCYTVNPPPGAFSFSSATYSANEGGATKTIVINRTGGSFGTVQVDYATYDGTATAGQDYAAASGTLIFNNGEVFKSFNIPILEDALDEADETVYLNLSFPTLGSTLGIPNTAILTIVDNEAAPTVSITDVSQFEGNVGTNQFSFRVQLSAPSALPIAVDFITADTTASFNQDYLPTNGTVNFAAGETLKNILVTVNGDLTTELDETFLVNLSNPVNATFSDNQALGTIRDDDNPGKFSFALAPYSGTENDSVMVTVSRTNGTAGTVSVDYVTTGGTATPISDYSPVAGTLVFGDGEITKTFFVSLGDDLIPEPTESVNLILSNPIGGATLGVPSVAVLNIFDNDSGTLLNLGGEVKLADNSPVANVTVTLQGSASATTTTDSSGRYTFPNLTPNGNYTVTPSALGYTFTPINRQYNNLAGDVSNANFTATAAPSRQVRIIGGNATPGQNVTVMVELVAQGDENAAGFSLNFDTAILTNPQAVLGPDAAAGFLTVNTSQTGKIGLLLALQSGQSFSAGTKQIVTVTFNTMATQLYSSPVTFGDVPIVKQVVNTNADPLPTIYLDGNVIFAQGFEADTAPRPTGNNNGTITVADFTQVGRFVAGLDTVNPAFNEYQRADSAPRITLGNGQLTVSDYTQAGRYAASLDPVTSSGGQVLPSFATILPKNEKRDSFALPTNVRVVSTQSSPGQQVIVSIETDTQGTENGFGFSIGYDPTKLSSPFVSKGLDTQNAALIPNTSVSGKVGVVLAMPFGQSVAAGTRQIVTIRFNVAANVFGGMTPLTMGDMPVFREVSDVDANVLPANFIDGQINILGPSSANVSISGRSVSDTGDGVSGAVVRLIDENGVEKAARTNGFGYFQFNDVETGRTYLLTASHKRFHFATQLVTVSDEIADLSVVGHSNQAVE